MSPILQKKLFSDDESTAKSGTGSGSGRCKESRGSHCNATPSTSVETIQSRAISALQNLGIERISKEDYAVGFKTQFGSSSRSRSLGSGSFATVHLHRDIRFSAGSGLFVAAKIHKRGVSVGEVWTELVYHAVLSRERKQVVGLIAWIDNGLAGSEESPAGTGLGGLILEHCNESLQAMWTRYEGLIPEVEQSVLLLDTLRGLRHVHSHAVVHLDLTPGNILIKWQAHDGLVAKIGDSGTSVRLREPPPGIDSANMNKWPRRWCLAELEPEFITADKLDDAHCTWTYRAPEITLGLPYAFPADVWSLGLIARELATGRSLFKLTETDCPWTYANYIAGPITNSCWPNVERAPRYKPMARGWKPDSWTSTRFCGDVALQKMEFVRALLQPDPSMRPSVAKALARAGVALRDGLEAAPRQQECVPTTRSPPAACLHLPSLPGAAKAAKVGSSTPRVKENPYQGLAENAGTLAKQGSEAKSHSLHNVFEGGVGDGAVFQAKCQCPGISSCGNLGFCEGKHSGVKKLCERPAVRSGINSNTKTYCNHCRCKYCDKIRFKSAACFRHQWKLTSIDHKFVRAFGPSLSEMYPVDLRAFEQQTQILQSPAAAVLAAQMWCPIAVQHFCQAVVSRAEEAKTPHGLFKIFVSSLQHVSNITQDVAHHQHRDMQDCWVRGLSLTGD